MTKWLGTADIVDRALEAAVVPSFARTGYELRSRMYDFRPPPRMDGRVVAVTGANSGIGLAACKALAAAGADVVLVCRDEGRGAEARSRVQQASRGGTVRLELCDLSRLADVRALADRLAAAGPLHVVVHNAGILPRERRASEDGNELTFATNALGPFLLTELLVSHLRASAPARVVSVSSGGMYTQRLRPDDLQFEGAPFDGTAAYARTKRIQVVLTEQWTAREGESAQVTFTSMHPGWANTPGLASIPRFQRLMRPLLRSAEQGADTAVWLASAPEATAGRGRFHLDRRPRPTHRLRRTHETAAERQQLWEQMVLLAGLADGRGDGA